MIVALTGGLGSGKTFGQTYFAWLTSYKSGGLPILANYPLRADFFAPHMRRNGAFKLYNVKSEDEWLQFTAGGGGVVTLDEVHRLVDARTPLSQGNIWLTQFFAFLRKLGAVTFLTDQTALFMDVRVRELVDVWVTCSKFFGPGGEITGFRYAPFDRWGRPGRTIYVPATTAHTLWGAYNTREIIHAFKFPASKKAFDEFLQRLDMSIKASDERRGVAEVPAPPAAVLDSLLQGA